MHIITNYSAGITQLVENCERAWPMPKRQQSNTIVLERQFPGQYAIGTTHGGRGGEIVTSFHVVECSQEIFEEAEAADDGSLFLAHATDCGRFGVLPGTVFAAKAKAWQARERRAAKKAQAEKAAAAKKSALEKAAKIAQAKARAADFSGDVVAWLAAPFQPAPACVVAAKQASGLSWKDFQQSAK